MIFTPVYFTPTDRISFEDIPREILRYVYIKEVNQEHYFEIQEWCKLHCRDMYYIPDMSILWELFGSFSAGMFFYFKNTTDAMYFKLKWVRDALDR